MDSKHRHELEQNVLAKWIVDQYEDWIRPNSNWLGYAVLGILIVIAIILVTARVHSWNRATAWKHYYAALQSEQAEAELEIIANSTSGIVGVQARLALAQRQLTEGCTQAFVDKNQAISLLEKGIASFQQVQKATNDSLILQEAGFGLAQCWEALAAVRVGDDLARSEDEYQKVVDRWEDGFTGQRAKKRLAQIRQPATKMFIELSAAKTVESLGTDDFKVNFDAADPFAPGQVDLSAFERGAETDTQKPDTDTEPKQESETNNEE